MYFLSLTHLWLLNEAGPIYLTTVVQSTNLSAWEGGCRREGELVFGYPEIKRKDSTIVAVTASPTATAATVFMVAAAITAYQRTGQTSHYVLYRLSRALLLPTCLFHKSTHRWQWYD